MEKKAIVNVLFTLVGMGIVVGHHLYEFSWMNGFIYFLLYMCIAFSSPALRLIDEYHKANRVFTAIFVLFGVGFAIYHFTINPIPRYYLYSLFFIAFVFRYFVLFRPLWSPKAKEKEPQ